MSVPAPRFALVAAALLACNGSAVLEGKETDDLADADDTDDVASPFAGDWTGALDGHAAFSEDWESAPYCSGTLSVEVSPAGNVSGSGDCVILWGPYVDLVFDVDFSGTIATDGTVDIETVFGEPRQEHVWDDVTLAGTADADARSGEAEGDTLYYPSGMEPIEAFARVTLG